MPEKFAHLSSGPQEGDIQVPGSDLGLQLPSPPFRSPSDPRGAGLESRMLLHVWS